MNTKNLFCTVLTYPAPSANYRGESELNRSVIQKITQGRFEYAIISPEAMRNALRELLAGYGLPCNRERLHDEEQLAVSFRSLPDPNAFVDDFFFGYLIAASGADRKKILEKVDKARRGSFRFKRDSVLRMNLAKALEPYRHDAVFTQSPLSVEGSAYRNATSSALLHRETTVTAFQYPFAISFNDCRGKPEWTRALLKAIGELNNVAGNHARSYYEMAPASLVARVTPELVAGYDLYGFTQNGQFPEVVDGLLQPSPDYDPAEFFLGGRIVKDLPDERRESLSRAGVTMERDPRKLLERIASLGLEGD